jgi:hypothetical protein
MPDLCGTQHGCRNRMVDNAFCSCGQGEDFTLGDVVEGVDLGDLRFSVQDGSSHTESGRTHPGGMIDQSTVRKTNPLAGGPDQPSVAGNRREHASHGVAQSSPGRSEHAKYAGVGAVLSPNETAREQREKQRCVIG